MTHVTAMVEALILTHRPLSAGEAVVMLDLLIEDHGRPRPDGLDRACLIAVRDWLADAVQPSIRTRSA